MSVAPGPLPLRELRVERIVAASPADVWRVMTGRLAEWFCPRPWTTEFVALEWRAGTRFATVLRGPDGEEHGNEGLMLAVEPERRFVFTDALDHGFRPQGPFMVGAFAVEPDGDGARLIGWARHWTAEAEDSHRAMGFSEGWAMVLNQIAELAESG